MLKAFLRLCTGAALCALLIYAPELYTAARAPYTVSVRERVLLRIALCSNHPSAADAFYKVLSLYMKEHPSHHLRVTRSDAGDLFASSDYPPDLYVFPENLPYHESLLLSVPETGVVCRAVVSSDDETLLCGIASSTAHPQQALSLLSYMAEKTGSYSVP